MKLCLRLLSIAAVCSVASGYYHFVYFASRSGQFTPVNLQFDLSKSNTVQYFISDQGPNVFVAGDSFTAVISELQLAAQAWNGIASSQLKLVYGGLTPVSGTQQTAPGIDVVFDDDNIATGILAQTKVTTYADVSSIAAGNTPFLPILRARIQLRRNLTVTSPQQASFYDSSFTTMVHEFGHAIGLQHTLTSATMSTYTTRSTTKAAPIAADDVAGVSLLYPTPGYLATTGTISGNVTLNGNGVNLASVVAISPTTGIAISNLTNPDGSYSINAIPPGSYLLYVHPLPPAATGEAGPDAIVLPQDASQNPFPANTGFVTQFFPATRDWTQAVPIGVSAGSASNASFNVQGSAGPVVYAMELAGFVNNATEFSPMLEANGSYSLEFLAPGTVVKGNQLAPGLNVSVIGTTAQVAAGYTRYYQQGYVSMGLYTSAVQSTTPVALAVTVNNDLYVLPAAFYVVPSGPPTLTNFNPASDGNGNPTLTVSGANLSTATRFVFDGTPVNAIANPDGSFTLSAPPAPANYSSSIEALNPDGQTSGQAIPSGTPPQFSYNYVNPATIASISPTLVSPGSDVMITINGSGTNFNNSQTTVGFGSSDIVVKQVLVINPQLLLVDVSVNASAPLAVTNVTVTTGLQTATFSQDLGTGGGMQIGAGSANQISLRAPITNLATGLAGIPAGGVAVINVSGIQQSSQTLTGWTLSITGAQPIVSPILVNGQILVTVPGSVPPGAAFLQLTPPSGPATPPIFMKVDQAPPAITSILNASGATIASTQQVHPGDTITLVITGLSDGVTAVNGQTVFVTGGVFNAPGYFSIPALSLNDPFIQIQIPASLPNGTLPISVGVGTRVSAPAFLSIHN